MGYYVTAQGTIEMPRSLEAEALHALRMLNYQHELKRGRRSPATGNPFDDSWYAWIPERYHEDPDINSVQDILEMVGYEVTLARKAGLNVYTLLYDNKTGQEEVFLNCLAGYAQVSIDMLGEDGQRWRWVNAKAGAPLEWHDAIVTYERKGTVSKFIERDVEIHNKIRSQYV
jgi:hypothetical protein